MNLETTYPRRQTRAVTVGPVLIGGGQPISVQTMITEETFNVEACVEQVLAVHRAGAEVVRITTPTLREAECFGEICRRVRASFSEAGGEVRPVANGAGVHGNGSQVEISGRSGARSAIQTLPQIAQRPASGVHPPALVADVHHQGAGIAVEAAKYADKVRINPGLFVFKKPTGKAEFSQQDHIDQRKEIEEQLLPVLQALKNHNAALRVGVNHGSLAERMLVTYGDTPEGMVESALEYLRICRRHDFENIVISMKASRVPIMLAANRLLAIRLEQEAMDYPIHLGVTEAGDGQYARLKSTAGIATLLNEGIGDTIRVSLAEDPANEIPVCYQILQSLGLRKTQVEYIACPSCGRTKFDLPTVLNEVREATKHLVGLDIAVMGCIVNGPGEMADADYGYVGAAGGKITLYRKKEIVRNGIPQEQGVSALIDLLKADGLWVEAPALSSS